MERELCHSSPSVVKIPRNCDQHYGTLEVVDRGHLTMSKKVIPFLLKLLTLSVILELRRKNGFNVLLIGCEDDPLANDQCLDSIWFLRIAAFHKHLPPEFVVAIM